MPQFLVIISNDDQFTSQLYSSLDEVRKAVRENEDGTFDNAKFINSLDGFSLESGILSPDYQEGDNQVCILKVDVMACIPDGETGGVLIL